MRWGSDAKALSLENNKSLIDNDLPSPFLHAKGEAMKYHRITAVGFVAFFSAAPAALAQSMVIGGPLNGTILPGPQGGMVIGGPLNGTIMPGANGGMVVGGPLNGTIMPGARGGMVVVGPLN
jgi:hypothetical protein